MTIDGNTLTYAEDTGNKYVRVFNGDQMTSTRGGVTEIYQRTN